MQTKYKLLLQINAIESGYGKIQILWKVSLQVAKGEIVALVGHNGAGKTTLLRTISGLLKPWGGTVTFCDERLEHATPDIILAKGIVHVPEGRALFPGMTVEDNLLMGAFLRNDKLQVKEDLEKVYTLFPILRQRRKQIAGKLSGGEQQMCAIARGIMSRPKLLIIDELSLGLAPAVVDHLATALCEIRAQGVSILLVEQDVLVALELSDKCYVMEHGRIIREGTPKEIDDDSFRRAYLGSA